MEGEIVPREPGERLHCRYHDRMFEVSVDLRVGAGPEGTVSTHIIEITPKTWVGSVMWPLIRLGLRKQTPLPSTHGGVSPNVRRLLG